MIDEKDYDLAQRGERVRFIFDKLGLEKSFVAKNIGCEPQAIFQWISRPDTNIKNPLLFKFADLTGYEARWIAVGEGPRERCAAKEGLLVTDPKVAKIAQILLAVQEEGKEYLVEATQKDLDVAVELDAQAAAHAKAKDC